jgi:hypothetical protein
MDPHFHHHGKRVISELFHLQEVQAIAVEHLQYEVPEQTSGMEPMPSDMFISK